MSRSTHAQANVMARIVTITTFTGPSRPFAYLTIEEPLPGGQKERLVELAFDSVEQFEGFCAAMGFVIAETKRQLER